MRLVFMGTPEFALASLAALIGAGHEVACVYAQSPRPAGRGMGLRLSPVAAFADAQGLPLRLPRSLKGDDEQAAFSALQADAAVVAAYGLILPPAILAAPRHGCFNVHASLLPRWRGPAPIQRAVMAGDKETGVTIMRMEAGLDTGPMCLAASLPIAPETTAGEMHDALKGLGAQLMVEALDRLEGGALACAPQPDLGVTYAQKIDKAETRIDFALPAKAVRNHINGLSPVPGAWAMIEHRGGSIRLKALKAALAEGAGPPGTVLDDGLAIASGEGAVRLLCVQREGKAPMATAAFLRGMPSLKGAQAG